MYKALDFNIREVFAIVFENEASLSLRLKDVRNLIQFRHFDDIKRTFEKPIWKRNIMRIFYDEDFSFKDEAKYVEYNLTYYIDVMIMDESTEEDIIDILDVFSDNVDINKLMLVFIKAGNFKLVQWAE
jgi:hypothetical protein